MLFEALAVGRAGDDIEDVCRVAVRERGGGRRDPRHGAAAVDGLVGQPVQQRRGEVVLGARCPQRVEQALHGGVGQGPIRSASGSARVRSGWAALAPSSTEPA